MKSTPLIHNASEISSTASKILNALIQATTECVLGVDTTPDSLKVSYSDNDWRIILTEFEIDPSDAHLFGQS